jgi:hypothetical protein
MFVFVFCVAELLNLPRNSKDAQVFEQYAKQMAGAPSAPGQFIVSRLARCIPFKYPFMIIVR